MRDCDIRWICQSSLAALRTGGVNRKELPWDHCSWDPEVIPTLLNKIQNKLRRVLSRDRYRQDSRIPRTNIGTHCPKDLQEAIPRRSIEPISLLCQLPLRGSKPTRNLLPL